MQANAQQDSSEDTPDDVEALDIPHAELVVKAMESQHPVTEVEERGEYTRFYRAVYYKPDAETAWMCTLQADNHPNNVSDPSVHFKKCHPTGSVGTLREWTSIATGRLGGPQNLESWETLFFVFNTASELYQEEIGVENRLQDTIQEEVDNE